MTLLLLLSFKVRCKSSNRPHMMMMAMTCGDVCAVMHQTVVQIWKKGLWQVAPESECL